MLRSAAKNHETVLPVVDPTDYPVVLELLRNGGLTADDPARVCGQGVHPYLGLRRGRRRLSDARRGSPAPPARAWPWSRCSRSATARTRSSGPALYVTEEPRGMRDLTQRQGKELSFNNLLDVDAGMCGGGVLEQPTGLRRHQAHHARAASRWPPSAVEAFRQARATDPVSAFGSVVAFNTVVDQATATGDGRSVRRSRRRSIVPRRGAGGLRGEEAAAGRRAAGEQRRRRAGLQAGAGRLSGAGPVSVRPVRGRDGRSSPGASPPRPSGTISGSPGPPWQPSSRMPSCWRGTKRPSASAPGQMSRVDSVFLAMHKARQQGHDPRGQRAGFRRVLPLCRRGRAGDRGRHHGDHSAGRIGPGRRSDRGGRPARDGHGHDRQAPVQTLMKVRGEQ